MSCSCAWVCSRWVEDGSHTPLLTTFLPPKTNPTEFPRAVTSTQQPCLTCVQREMPGQSLLATKHFSTHITGKQLVVKFPRWQSISHFQPQLFCFYAKKHKVILRTLKTCGFHSVEPCRRHIKCSTWAACCVIWHMSSFRKETPNAGKEMNLPYTIFHTHSEAEHCQRVKPGYVQRECQEWAGQGLTSNYGFVEQPLLWLFQSPTLAWCMKKPGLRWWSV